MNSAVVQLVAAVSSLTFVLVTGVKGLLGLGPAIFLVAAALTGAVAGRAMDRFGRRPVLVIGFLVGGSGCAITALGTHAMSTVAVIVGFALTGSSSATALLVRTAAGDMYLPERRARGISFVLFGSVFGAILGPTVFSPLFAGKQLEASELTVPWLAAAGDQHALGRDRLPRPAGHEEDRGAHRAATDTSVEQPARARSARSSAGPASSRRCWPSFASFGVMVSVMNLTGYVVVEKHGHAQHDVFPIIGAHVLGMYALVLVVGALIDRVGRTPALATGLLVMGVAALSLGLDGRASRRRPSSSSSSASAGTSRTSRAAAQLADLTLPSERGRLFGFNDFAAAMFAASLALLGGLTLETLGVAAMAVGAAIIVTVPAPWILRRREVPVEA